MTIAADLKTALEALEADVRWRERLAEQMYWASYEGHLQGSLLGAFNLTSEAFIADRERYICPVHRYFHPDLSIMTRAAHKQWWKARLASPTDRETLSQLCKAVVELKLLWTPGNAIGSATAPNRIKKIADDVDRVVDHRNRNSGCQGFVGVLAGGFHLDGDGEKEVDAAIAAALDAIKARGHKPQLVAREDFLTGYEADHWKAIARGSGEGETTKGFASFFLYEV